MAGKRIRRSGESWRVLLAEQAASGLSVAAFCAQERLSTASFYQWRSRLAGGTAVQTQERREAFVDLGALGAGGCFQLRIELGGGVVLQLARG